MEGNGKEGEDEGEERGKTPRRHGWKWKEDLEERSDGREEEGMEPEGQTVEKVRQGISDWIPPHSH